MKDFKFFREEIICRIALGVHLIENIFMWKKKRELGNLCENIDFSLIPIFIVNYNRVSYVSSLVEKLRKDGFKNINIIDNNSTYPPLIDYYKDCECNVIRLDYNGGARVFWEDNRFKKYRENFYIVTDPDIFPIEECVKDYVKCFVKILCKYPFVKKVGFSLKIDDIPSDAVLANEILKFESRYNKIYMKKENVFYAPIDTTFAVYLPDFIGEKIPFYRAFRTNYPIQARHLPWYKKSEDVTDEDLFYSNNKTNGWWDYVKGKVTPD